MMRQPPWPRLALAASLLLGAALPRPALAEPASRRALRSLDSQRRIHEAGEADRREALASIHRGAYALASRRIQAQLQGPALAEPLTRAPAPVDPPAPLLLRLLRQRAAEHTNSARAVVDQALSLSDKARRDRQLALALADYRTAAEGWGAYLALDPRASDAAESRYWLADALHLGVALEVALGRSPSAEAIARARAAAVAARDAPGDDLYRQPAAVMVVDIAEQAVSAQHQRFARTQGAEGFEARTEVKTRGEPSPEVVSEPWPPEIQAAVTAREEYLARIPSEEDVGQNRVLYAFQIAEAHYLHGHLAEARARYLVLHRDQCQKSKWGYRSLDRLMAIANLQRDVPESRRLAEELMARPCDLPGEPPRFPPPHRSSCGEGPYLDAEQAFHAAQEMPEGPARRERWSQAAELYRAALERDPARSEAPEAAVNGAYAYKQIGAYARALEVYRLFLRTYGAEARLARLEKGDPRATPPVPPDPHRHQESLGFVTMAMEGLATALLLSFDYPATMTVYEEIAGNRRFTQAARSRAAHNVAILAHQLGDEARSRTARALFVRLKAAPAEVAELDAALRRQPSKAVGAPHRLETAALLAPDLLARPLPAAR